MTTEEIARLRELFLQHLDVSIYVHNMSSITGAFDRAVKELEETDATKHSLDT